MRIHTSKSVFGKLGERKKTNCQAGPAPGNSHSHRGPTATLRPEQGPKDWRIMAGDCAFDLALPSRITPRGIG